MPALPNQAFYSSGQAMYNSAALLPELVNSGVRLLAYAGDTDGVFNYQGIELWKERLDHHFHVEFGLTSPEPWRTEKRGYFAGTTRTAGEGAGNVIFVCIFNAGHLAPHDQPEASLDMIAH
ncbi:Alpha/Beta hydrolase protein [Irpex rosettiformis]|uniref:Alpha/Beta hydrolase protein n=1 Tax=Irpex rosettiformis TaxID=378272 RepID=A0ACB8ULC3_9APHY|nr:Alpha/Beta hydrolase protein [Irpex rosettiformis]